MYSEALSGNQTGQGTMPVLSGQDEHRWQAVISNDDSADGTFFYSVLTTGVYCRPSCPSRRPNRENVRFFDLAEAAEQAGYRACKRCHPRQTEPSDPALSAVSKACRFIEQADETIPQLEEIAATAGFSPHHFHRLFKKTVGITPKQYHEACRISRLKHNLKSGDNVAAALYGAGYGSSSRLYEKANDSLGMSPASYGKGGKGAVVAWTVTASNSGNLLVAATGKGVCFVALGADRAELETSLTEEFPNAVLQEDSDGLGEIVGSVLEIIAGREPDRNLPLDIQGTAFQRQVWQALLQIPKGETRSYREIAEAIGKDGAMRAVGRACATNPVALIVPCHRVIAADGNMRGYRWGEERKKTLLENEGALSA